MLFCFRFLTGGFIISAKSDPDACKTPPLGLDHFYFIFEMDEEG